MNPRVGPSGPGPRAGLSPRLRWALVATVLLCAWVLVREPDGVSDAVVGQASPSTPGVARPALQRQPTGVAPWPVGVQARDQGWPVVSAAERRSWGEAEPAAPATPRASGAAAASAGPAEDSAPPAPAWQLVGQMTPTVGNPTATLVNGSKTAVVEAGERLDAQWRVVRVEPGSVVLGLIAAGATAASGAEHQHTLRLPAQN
ncbi:MAG: hypothetical protein LW768_06885 [Rubrivivax sp.]|jgi:hypothetical protein|nr:hypothetical protein [Rubrivivax sp.]